MTAQPVLPRIWAKVDRGAPNECWPWRAGGRDRRGYGLISYLGFPRRVVRILCALEHGLDLFDTTWLARHSCHNPPCCNPAHLTPGSPLENSADMVAAGRSLKGERHPSVKLTDAQVGEIRRRRAVGESRRALATEFGIHPESVTRITGGRSR